VFRLRVLAALDTYACRPVPGQGDGQGRTARLRIPATMVRYPRPFRYGASRYGSGQKAQIVQSQFDLRDLLP